MNPPRKRRDDVLTTKLDDEVVIYDPETKQAHTLNRVAVSVWNHSEEASTVEDLREKVSEDIGASIEAAAILTALRRLERANLLVGKISSSGPMTRRDLLVKGGKLGAAAAVTPLIASALVPIAAAAASPTCSQAGSCGNFQDHICAHAPNGTTCYCWQTAEGGTFCGGDFFCPPVSNCNVSGDCPGTACVVNTCCGIPACSPACGAGIAPSHGPGLTAAG
jgi:hypothetical protein